MENESVGAIIGRFQIDELHRGHRALIDYVRERHKRVVILVGVRPVNPDSRHPLSFEVRRNMLQKTYPDVLILPIRDYKEDEAWSRNVDSLLQIAVGEWPVTFYSGRLGFVDHYHGRHSVEVVDLTPKESASERRREIQTSATELDSKEFRAGIIHGVMNRHPQIEPVVDAAIVDSQNQIVLGRKHGERKWRLPGGWVDHSDPTLEVTATREAAEETGLSIDPTGWVYGGNYMVDDWRVKDSPDHFMRTVLFVSFAAHHGALRPGDDLVEVKWVSLELLKNQSMLGDIAENHRVLIEKVIEIVSKRNVEEEKNETQHLS